MKATELSWVYLLDCLSEESKPPSYIRVLDTLIFDPLNSLRPLFWVYTSDIGKLCKYNLRDWTVPEIIDNVLHVYNSYKNAVLIQIPLSGLRYTIENPSAAKIILHNLQAVQLYTNRHQLDPKTFVHYYSIENEEKVYCIENAREQLVEIMNPINFRIKAVSGLILHKLKTINCYSLVSIKILYQVDLYSKDPWVIGFSECMFEHSYSPPKTSNFIKDSASTSFLSVKNMKLKQNIRELVKGTPMIRGKHLRIHSKDKAKSKLSASVNIFKEEISRTVYPSLTDESYSKALPIAESCYNQPCRGHFCKLESVKMPRYDKALRCLIPFYLIEKGKRSDYSPFINPCLRKIPSSNKSIGKKTIVFTKLHYTKEVPVCLKCYIVYYNIKEKNKKNLNSFDNFRS